MLRYKHIFNLTTVLVIVVMCFKPTVAEFCVWCNPVLSQNFVNCINSEILSSQTLGPISKGVLDDMKNSMNAASQAIRKSSDSMKMKMLNGAMAGEFVELIKSRPSPGNQENMISDLMEIVGYCYEQASGQSHSSFSQELGKTVNFMLNEPDEPVADESSSRGDSTRPQYPSESYVKSAPFNGQNINKKLPTFYNAPQQQPRFGKALPNQGNYLPFPEIPLEVIPYNQNAAPSYQIPLRNDQGDTNVNTAGLDMSIDKQGNEPYIRKNPLQNANANAASSSYSFQQNNWPNVAPNIDIATQQNNNGASSSAFSSTNQYSPLYNEQGQILPQNQNNQPNFIPLPIIQSQNLLSPSSAAASSPNPYTFNDQNLPPQNPLIQNPIGRVNQNRAYPINENLPNQFDQSATDVFSDSSPNEPQPNNDYDSNYPPMYNGKGQILPQNQNKQPNLIPLPIIQRQDLLSPRSTAANSPKSFTLNDQNLPQQNPLFQSPDGRVNQDGAYPLNENSPNQFDQSATDVFSDSSPNEPQPNDNYDSNYPVPISADSSSATSSDTDGNPSDAATQGNGYPSDNSQPNKKRAAPKKRKQKSRPKHSKSKNKKPLTTTKSHDVAKSKSSSPSGNDGDVIRAMKFSETLYIILSQSDKFKNVFNEGISNDDATSCLYRIVVDALNNCGYPAFAIGIANACIVAIKSLPEKCTYIKYGETISKLLMSQFYKKKLINKNPESQATSIATALLASLKEDESFESSKPTSPSSSTTKSGTTPASKTSSTSKNADDASTDDWRTRVEKEFYETLFNNLLKSSYFRNVYNEKISKSDAKSCTAAALINCLYLDFGDKLALETALECQKRMSSVPKGSKTEVFAVVIAKCVSDIFSNYDIISLEEPSIQASDISSDIIEWLKNIENNGTDQSDNDSPAPKDSPKDAKDDQVDSPNDGIPDYPETKGNMSINPTPSTSDENTDDSYPEYDYYATQHSGYDYPSKDATTEKPDSPSDTRDENYYTDYDDYPTSKTKKEPIEKSPKDTDDDQGDSPGDRITDYSDYPAEQKDKIPTKPTESKSSSTNSDATADDCYPDYDYYTTQDSGYDYPNKDATDEKRQPPLNNTDDADYNDYPTSKTNKKPIEKSPGKQSSRTLNENPDDDNTPAPTEKQNDDSDDGQQSISTSSTNANSSSSTKPKNNGKNKKPKRKNRQRKRKIKANKSIANADSGTLEGNKDDYQTNPNEQNTFTVMDATTLQPLLEGDEFPESSLNYDNEKSYPFTSSMPSKNKNSDTTKNSDKDRKVHSAIIFFDALYYDLLASTCFNDIYNEETSKSDAKSCTATALIHGLYSEYGNTLTLEIAQKCKKRISAVPASSNTEVFATVIAKCVTDVFSHYNIISLETPSAQALEISRKIIDWLNVDNKCDTDQLDDNSPVKDDSPTDTIDNERDSPDKGITDYSNSPADLKDMTPTGSTVSENASSNSRAKSDEKPNQQSPTKSGAQNANLSYDKTFEPTAQQNKDSDDEQQSIRTSSAKASSSSGSKKKNRGKKKKPKRKNRQRKGKKGPNKSVASAISNANSDNSQTNQDYVPMNPYEETTLATNDITSQPQLQERDLPDFTTNNGDVSDSATNNGDVLDSATNNDGFPDSVTNNNDVLDSTINIDNILDSATNNGDIPDADTSNGGFPDSATKKGGFPDSATKNGDVLDSATNNDDILDSVTNIDDILDSATNIDDILDSITNNDGFPDSAINNGDIPDSATNNGDFPDYATNNKFESKRGKSYQNADPTSLLVQGGPDVQNAEVVARVKILIKWALSSLSNGKFNYKLFSRVIAALAKYMQNVHPEKGSQECLVKILIESLIACIHLLIQVPPDYFNNIGTLINPDAAMATDSSEQDQYSTQTDQNNAGQYDPTYFENPASPPQQNNWNNENGNSFLPIQNKRWN